MNKGTLLKAGGVLSFAIVASCGGGGGGGGGGSDSVSDDTTSLTTTVDPIITSTASWNLDDATSFLGLTPTGLWHISDIRASSAPNALRYADTTSNTYDTGTANAGSIILPEMTLGTAPALNLQHFLANECNDVLVNGSYVPGQPCGLDRLTVAISTDQGASYTEIAELNPSTSDAFSPDAIDLAPYAGQTVTLAITFDTVTAAANGYEGAYVDDINIVDGGVWAHSIKVIGEGLVTDETGTEQSFQVVLNTPPAADVTIPVSSSTPSEGLIKGGDYPDSFVTALNLTFTPSNWNVPQTVTVQGVADGIYDPNQPYQVVLGAAVSNDTGYNGADGRNVNVTNVNTDPRVCDGNNLWLGNDVSVPLNIGFTFPFQGTGYDAVYIGSNGYLTFGAASTLAVGNKAQLVKRGPRIAALWDDLDPSQGGTISCTSDGSSMTISYQNVPELGTTNSNSFTITLSSGGTIAVTYGEVAATAALVGISEGTYINPSTAPDEIKLSDSPVWSNIGTTFELFAGGGDDFDLANQTLTFAPAP